MQVTGSGMDDAQISDRFLMAESQKHVTASMCTLLKLCYCESWPSDVVSYQTTVQHVDKEI
jgi:hypothetical protein